MNKMFQSIEEAEVYKRYHVPSKYFLSDKAVQGLMKGQAKPQFVPLQQEDTQEECTHQ